MIEFPLLIILKKEIVSSLLDEIRNTARVEPRKLRSLNIRSILPFNGFSHCRQILVIVMMHYYAITSAAE
jgi:hypothetical protein